MTSGRVVSLKGIDLKVVEGGQIEATFPEGEKATASSVEWILDIVYNRSQPLAQPEETEAKDELPWHLTH